MSKYMKISILAPLVAVFVFGIVATSAFATPAFAAKTVKSDVCHYQAEDVFEDEVLVSPLGWRIINISGNALKAHVGMHTDGVDSDFVINDEVDLAACMALEPFIEEVDEDEEA